MKRQTRMAISVLLLLSAILISGCSTTAQKASGNQNDPISTPWSSTSKVSYLGPEGTYTEEAVQLFFDEKSELFPQKTVEEAIAELQASKVDFAVIPQENTIGGPVVRYIDALIAQDDIHVVGEVVLPIGQTLMGLPGTRLEDVKTVCSHAQGLSQSRTWRSTNLPAAVEQEMPSTAAAARYVAETKDSSIAAVAAPGAARIYGLEVLAENVQISMENRTRFYVLSREALEGKCTNALLVAECHAERIDDMIVSLHDSGLEPVALHARPEGSALGSYRYIIEVRNKAGITEAQTAVMEGFDDARFYGCFNVVEK